MNVPATMLWQSPWLLPAAAVTLAAALAAIVLLYAPQVRDVPRGWRWLPPLLRGMAVAAIAVSMLQPAVLRPRTEAQQGAVVVLVDQSRSMSVSDRGRSPAELIALAAGLGTLPPGARRESAPGLRGQLEVVRARIEQVERTRGEADYARLSGRGLPAAQARLNDAADALRDALAQVALPPGAAGSDLPQRIEQLKQPLPALDEPSTRALRTRLDAAVRALAADQARADEKLFEDDQAVRTACIRTGRMTRAALAELALTQKQTGLLFNVPAGAPVLALGFSDEVAPLPSLTSRDLRSEGAASDVTGAVRQALRTLAGRDVQAVVLLSDGRHVGGEEPANADMSALRAPVFAVGVAPPGQRLDVAIARVDVPAGARVDQPVMVRVELKAPGTSSGDFIDVQLETEDLRRVQRVAVGDDWTAGAEFELTFAHPGPASVTVTALPRPGEISEQNNRAQRWIKVGEDPLRVTVIAAADAGRQFSALHEVLSRAPWVTLREVDEADTYRLSAATLANQHVVILCDLPGDALWPEQWNALQTMVAQRGGTLIITAGAHLPGGAYTAQSPAADWLPFDVNDRPSWQSWPGGEPYFRVAPARDDAGAWATSWRQLPALSRFVALTRPRAGITPLLVEASSGAAVVTQSQRGAGRVVFVGTDETWRWHSRTSAVTGAVTGAAGASDAHQFWPALLRHVAPQPYAAIAGSISLDATPIAPQPRQAIALRARLLHDDGTPLTSSRISATLWQDDEPIRTIALRSIGDGRFEGALEGLDAGEYLLELAPPGDLDVDYDAQPAYLPLTVEPNAESELSDLAGDAALLRRIAESSGGRYLPLDQLPTLAALLAENRAKQTEFIEYTLWDSPWLFAFVLACLSTEWALRKKFGLA